MQFRERYSNRKIGCNVQLCFCYIIQFSSEIQNSGFRVLPTTVILR
jgi:hypothetical protein